MEEIEKLIELRKNAKNEMKRLKNAFIYLEKYFEELLENTSDEECKTLNYCNAIKHVLMDSYDKIVKIEDCSDRICRLGEEK